MSISRRVMFQNGRAHGRSLRPSFSILEDVAPAFEMVGFPFLFFLFCVEGLSRLPFPLHLAFCFFYLVKYLDSSQAGNLFLLNYHRTNFVHSLVWVSLRFFRSYLTLELYPPPVDFPYKLTPPCGHLLTLGFFLGMPSAKRLPLRRELATM